MPNYRRLYVPGGTYFFTLTLHDRGKTLLTDYFLNLYRAWRRVDRRWSFELCGAVVLPDHLHVLITLPDGDDNYPKRIRRIKDLFTRSLPEIEKGVGRKGERKVWQPRYWEHLIRDDAEFEAYMDYIYYNPVKHGFVTEFAEWPYSTYRWHQRKFIHSHALT